MDRLVLETVRGITRPKGTPCLMLLGENAVPLHSYFRVTCSEARSAIPQRRVADMRVRAV